MIQAIKFLVRLPFALIAAALLGWLSIVWILLCWATNDPGDGSGRVLWRAWWNELVLGKPHRETSK